MSRYENIPLVSNGQLIGKATYDDETGVIEGRFENALIKSFIQQGLVGAPHQFDISVSGKASPDARKYLPGITTARHRSGESQNAD